MLLTERHIDGYMHGLNIRYLTPIQQQQLQHYFQPPADQQKEHVNPFQQEQVKRYQQQLDAEKKQQQLLNQEEGYVVRPAPNSTYGVATFTRTASAIVQKARGAYGLLRRLIPFGGLQQPPPPPETPSPFTHVQQHTVPIIDNPTMFYYQYVKPLLGSETKNSYRKYNPIYIRNFTVRTFVTRNVKQRSSQVPPAGI